LEYRGGGGKREGKKKVGELPLGVKSWRVLELGWMQIGNREVK
jgi:hypothetical protein